MTLKKGRSEDENFTVQIFRNKFSISEQTERLLDSKVWRNSDDRDQ